LFNKQNGSPYCLPRHYIENNEDNEDTQLSELDDDSLQQALELLGL